MNADEDAEAVDVHKGSRVRELTAITSRGKGSGGGPRVAAASPEGGESTMAKLFLKVKGSHALVIGLTVVAALSCAGFFDGPH
jgi:hypothetical protein